MKKKLLLLLFLLLLFNLSFLTAANLYLVDFKFSNLVKLVKKSNLLTIKNNKRFFQIISTFFEI